MQALMIPMLLILVSPPIVYTPTMRLFWDPVTKDIMGHPETIKCYEVQLWNADATQKLRSTGSVQHDPAGWDPAEFMKTVEPGIYVFRVCAIDMAGNYSEPSDPSAQIEKIIPDTVKPEKPGNVRVGIVTPE